MNIYNICPRTDIMFLLFPIILPATSFIITYQKYYGYIEMKRRASFFSECSCYPFAISAKFIFIFLINHLLNIFHHCFSVFRKIAAYSPFRRHRWPPHTARISFRKFSIKTYQTSCRFTADNWSCIMHIDPSLLKSVSLRLLFRFCSLIIFLQAVVYKYATFSALLWRKTDE